MSTARPVVVVAFGASQRATAAAGPVVSIKALTEVLADQYDFRVLAKPTAGLGERVVTPEGWAQLISYFRSTPHDLVVLSSFFDREYTMPVLQMRRLGLIPRKPTILSPRGEFSPGALELKPGRKKAYFAFARRLGLLQDVWMHATGPAEADDIRRTYPYCRGILTAQNLRVLRPLPPARLQPASSQVPRIAFLSRIDRKKNLDYAIRVLGNVSRPVRFDVFGPVTHQDYWEECQSLAKQLPSHIEFRYLGGIAGDTVLETLAGYDLFFLPTRGENFGHAIFDALEAGLPILISDQTPWQNLEQLQAGWCLPLDRPEAFAAAITQVASASPDERMILSKGARRLAEASVKADDALQATKDMFREVLAQG